jgi:hypothetical protein
LWKKGTRATSTGKSGRGLACGSIIFLLVFTH